MIFLTIAGSIIFIYVLIGLIGTAIATYLKNSGQDSSGDASGGIFLLSWFWPIALGFYAGDKISRVWREIK